MHVLQPNAHINLHERGWQECASIRSMTKLLRKIFVVPYVIPLLSICTTKFMSLLECNGIFASVRNYYGREPT